MLTGLELLWVLGVPFVLGALAVAATGLRPSDDRLGFLAWSWPLGCLSLGAALYVWLELGVEPALWWTAPVFTALVLGLLATRSMRGQAPLVVAPPRGGRLFVVGVAVLALFVLLHIAAGANRPCIEADEGNIWSLRAKSLLFDWGTPGFAAAQKYNLHADYPLLNPLLQSWVLSQHGSIVHFENRFLVQGCALALWLALAAALRARLPGLLALPLAAIVLFDPDFVLQCRLAYADAMLALGLVLALDGQLRWRTTGNAGFAWLSGLGLAFALWAKNEAVLYAGCWLLAVVATRWWRPRSQGTLLTGVLVLLPGVVVVGLQGWFNRRFALRSDMLGANPTGKTVFELFALQWRERLPAIADRAVETLLSLQLAHGVFVVLVLAPLVHFRAALGPLLRAPTLALLGALLGVHLVYVGSHLDLTFHLDTSYTRVLFQLLPVTLVWFAAWVQQVLQPSPQPMHPSATATVGPETTIRTGPLPG